MSSRELVPMIPEPSITPQLSKEYILPSLPKPPQSYMECRTQREDIKDKIEFAVSSPTRESFIIAREGTPEFLMRGSLGEMEIANARASQVRVHRAKLNSRQSLPKGGSLLASDGLDGRKQKARIIPPEMLIPIRDREKAQSAMEAEEVSISLQSLVDMVAKEQAEFDAIVAKDPALLQRYPSILGFNRRKY